jgi:hypothetical protein
VTLKLNLVIIYNITVEGVVNQVCCHSELVSIVVPNNLTIKKQDAASNCCLSYNKVVQTIK